MAIKCYKGSATPSGSFDTWATAYNVLATALAALSSGDTLRIDMTDIASGDAEVAGSSITWTVPAGVTLEIGTPVSTSDITIGDMGTTYWFGKSTALLTIAFTFGANCRIRGGLTLRQHSNGAVTIHGALNGGLLTADAITVWHSNSATSSGQTKIGGSARSSAFIGTLTIEYAKNSSTIQTFGIAGDVRVGNLVLNTGGATGASTGWLDDTNAYTSSRLTVDSGDITALGSGATLVSDCSHAPFVCRLDNVVLPGSFVPMASQSGGVAGAELILRDCSESGVGDVPFLYANNSGEIRVDDGIYLTAGIASASWRITTTSACSEGEPFISPWINEYLAASTVEPMFEVARDGSASAYTDAQWYLETLAKETTSSVINTLSSTKGTGTNIPTGVGTGSWTGLSGTAWSGELTQGSTVLAEPGNLRSRIVGVTPSATLYVDVGAAA